MVNKKAVVLLSGGLDSAVTLYFAKKEGFKCHCLIFDYGQRHRKEIESAKKIAHRANCDYKVIKIRLPWGGSSLLDRKIKLPITNYPDKNVGIPKRHKSNHYVRDQLPITIPSTYVPARNTIFLSFALSYAEAIRAKAIFIGAHAQDYSGYPDCRPEFYRAFNRIIAQGTKAGIEKKGINIKTPLIYKTKAEIIRLGSRLRVPFELTRSCYRGGKRPCQECDSCYFRAKGFQEAGIEDPLLAGASRDSPLWGQSLARNDCPATR